MTVALTVLETVAATVTVALTVLETVAATVTVATETTTAKEARTVPILGAADREAGRGQAGREIQLGKEYYGATVEAAAH